jgi:hypothetical protein
VEAVATPFEVCPHESRGTTITFFSMACVLAATPCILEMQHTEDTWPPEQPAGGPRGRSTPSPGRRSSRAGRPGLRAGKPGQAREGEAGPAGEQGRPGLRATQAWLEDRLAKLWMILMLRVEWSECDVRQLPASLPAYASEAVGCAMFLRLKQLSQGREPGRWLWNHGREPPASASASTVVTALLTPRMCMCMCMRVVSLLGMPCYARHHRSDDLVPEASSRRLRAHRGA